MMTMLLTNTLKPNDINMKLILVNILFGLWLDAFDYKYLYDHTPPSNCWIFVGVFWVDPLLIKHIIYDTIIIACNQLIIN